MAKSTPFRCETCGWSGTKPCVVGKIGTKVWIKQIPLRRWHRSRTEMYKKLKAAQKAQ